MTVLQTLERRNATYDPDADPPPLTLDSAQEAAWRRVVGWAESRCAAVDVAAFPTHLELYCDEPRLQLDYRGDSADLAVPYWFSGDAAVATIAVAYALGQRVEKETGLQGVDCQTELGLAVANVPVAVQSYSATSAFAQTLRDQL